MILIEPGVINSNFVPNIKFPRLINEKSKSGKLRKNVSPSHYSETIDAFLSHYYPLMKNASSHTLVSRQILEAVKIASSSSQHFFRYTVGEDSKSLATAKKGLSDFQLHEFITNRMLEKDILTSQ
jgi:hypothetical protein